MVLQLNKILCVTLRAHETSKRNFMKRLYFVVSSRIAKNDFFFQIFLFKTKHLRYNIDRYFCCFV